MLRRLLKQMLKQRMLKRRGILATLSAILATLLIATAVLAAYSVQISITETASNSYDMLPLMWTANNDWMADNGFMRSDGLDTRVQTLGGLNKPHLVAEDRTLTAVPVTAGGQTNLQFATGETALSAMDIITGQGGYITIPDDATLEPADDFEFEWADVWLDTSVAASKYLLHKTDAVEVYTGVVNEEVTATIYSAATDETPLLPEGVGAETNLALFGAPTNWQACASDDGDTTYVHQLANAWLRDTYDTQDSAIASGPINSVTVFIKARELVAGGAQAMTALRTHGVVYDGAVKNLVAAYALYSTVYADNPNTVAAWTWAEVDAMEVGVSLKGDGAVPAYCTYVYATVNYTPQVDVTVAGVASGEHDIEVAADTVNLTIDVDSGTYTDSAALIAGVVGNANDWVLMDNSTTDFMSYMGSYSHTVGGSLVTRYEPNDIIVDIDGATATLPDREVAGNDAVITWGANPSGISISVGSMTSTGQDTVGSAADATTRDILGTAGGSDWMTEPDTGVGGVLTDNPLRSIITAVSDSTQLSERQVWVFAGITFVVMVLVGTASHSRGHHLITGVATGAAVTLMIVFTIFPLWAAVFVVVAIWAGFQSERSPTL